MGQEGSDVTRADRAAAWPFRPVCYDVRDKEAWMQGRYDAVGVIRAFAAHRIATLNAARTAAWHKMSAHIRVCRFCGIKFSPVEQLDCSKHVGWIR